jgi:mRNA-capping enzyme
MKEMFNIWDAKFLMPKFIDSHKLEHENDGLIFTVDLCPYYPGTCEEILKWKPIELNSIDFKLQATPNPSIF